MKKGLGEKLIVIVTAMLFALALIALIVADTKESVENSDIPAQVSSPVEVMQTAAPVITEESTVQVSEAQSFVKPSYSFPEDFTTELLGEELFQPCPEGGTVQHLSYSAIDVATGAKVNKLMDVYVPYAYSPENQYNVLILSPGSGGSQEEWFKEFTAENGVTCSARNLLDNMIYTGKIAPVIVASVTVVNEISCNGMTYDIAQLAIDGDQLASELVDSIIPRLIESFSTYAEGKDRDSIKAAREHFGYIGLSWGSLMGYYRVFPNDIEYMAWYGLMSTSTLRVSNIANAVKNKVESCPIGFIYASCGTNDSWFSMSESLHNNFAENVPGVTDGENAAFVGINGGRHSFGTWIAGLYNCLLAFFE